MIIGADIGQMKGETMMKNTNYPSVYELPKFIILKAHDEQGNERDVAYIKGDAISEFLTKVNNATEELSRFELIERRTDE